MVLVEVTGQEVCGWGHVTDSGINHIYLLLLDPVKLSCLPSAHMTNMITYMGNIAHSHNPKYLSLNDTFTQQIIYQMRLRSDLQIKICPLKNEFTK